jgi:hypothetical protein
MKKQEFLILMTIGGASLVGTLLIRHRFQMRVFHQTLSGLHAEAREPLASVIQPWQLAGILVNAPASAGFHPPDPPRSTTAAVDLDVRV